jgi:hypothetical protein
VQVSLVLVRSFLYFSLILGIASGVAAAQSGPDNRYCNPGDQASFGSEDGPATLPQACIYTAMAETPSGGKVINVPAGGNLQAALDSAQCGDTVALAANAKYVGSFRLRARSCDRGHWITVRTAASDASLPDEGTRLTPCYAGVASLPGRPALGCTKVQRVIPQVVTPNGNPVFTLDNGANHYRLMGLEITRSLGDRYVGKLIAATPGQAADHIIVDRVWLHGDAVDETATAVHFSGMTHAAVIDSYLNDFHCTSMVGTCTDAHVIAGGVGSLRGGPYKVVGNFMEASGENILLGGGTATTTPADIEIRRNHMFKPMTWKKGQPGFVSGKGGHPFAVKNLTELKNAQRVLMEGNIYENSWGGFSQSGGVILLTPRNQVIAGKALCPSCQVTDVTIRYSTMSHSGMGISIAAGLTGTPPRFQGKAAARYSIHDVTMDDINKTKYQGGGTLFQVFDTWPVNGLNSVTINHVTGFADPNGHLITLQDPSSNPKIPGFVFTNNLVLAARYPVWSAGGGQANCAHTNFPVQNLNGCFTGYKFASNAIIGSPSQYPPSQWPANNWFPSSTNAVLFVNYASANAGNYQLLSASPFRNKGTDGKDLGADIEGVLSATEGVR